jgi:hypothetical protein
VHFEPTMHRSNHPATQASQPHPEPARIAQPEQEVLAARAKLEASLDQASASGQRLLMRAIVPAACGALLLGGLWWLARSRSRQPRFVLFQLTTAPTARAGRVHPLLSVAWTLAVRYAMPRALSMLQQPTKPSNPMREVSPTSTLS